MLFSRIRLPVLKTLSTEVIWVHLVHFVATELNFNVTKLCTINVELFYQLPWNKRCYLQLSGWYDLPEPQQRRREIEEDDDLPFWKKTHHNTVYKK